MHVEEPERAFQRERRTNKFRLRKISGEMQARNVSVGLQSLDGVDLREVLERRFVALKSIPPFMRDFYSGAMRLVFKTVAQGRVEGNVDTETRVWTFLLLIRMILFTRPRGGLVTHQMLSERSNKFTIRRVGFSPTEKFDCCCPWRGVEPSQETTTSVQ